MLSVQEIHFYNNLVRDEKVKNIISCPFDKDDIIVTKIDEDDKPYFYCLTCKSTFKLTKDIEDVIYITINKFIK